MIDPEPRGYRAAFVLDRPVDWARLIVGGTMVPPRPVAPRRWPGIVVLAVVILLVAVPMVLQVTR